MKMSNYTDLTQDVLVGQKYEFYAEMQQAEMPEQERMRNYTGQTVTVLAGPLPKDDEEGSDLFKICAADGREFEAFEEELNGWNKALGQYFWPDGTYGPDRDRTYLVNERRPSNYIEHAAPGKTGTIEQSLQPGEKLAQAISDADLLDEINRRGILQPLYGAIGAMHDHLDRTGALDERLTQYLAYRLRREEAAITGMPDSADRVANWQECIDQLDREARAQERPSMR